VVGEFDGVPGVAAFGKQRGGAMEWTPKVVTWSGPTTRW
jgi:hypothetical protein